MVDLPIPFDQPSAASIRPTFQPPVTSFPSFSSPASYETKPNMHWPSQYSPQIPSQFERPPAQIVPRWTEPPVTHSFTVAHAQLSAIPTSTVTEQSCVSDSLQTAPSISVADSSRNVQRRQQPVTANDKASSQCVSIDADLMELLADMAGPNHFDGSQVDLELLTDFLSGPLADTGNRADATAATDSVASNVISSHSQMPATDAELQDVTILDFSDLDLQTQLQQLNEFGKLT